MLLLDLTLGSPAENLACDEALLDWCETGQRDGVLRFWEPREYFVVLGYANKAAVEVNIEACQKRGVPVFRRCTGGGAVLQGPGCLNYSLVLRIAGALQSITQTNCFVMQRNRDALSRTLSGLMKGKVEVRGDTDLAMDDLKFSGNSQRRRREFLLFHGSFLLNFDLGMIEELLKFPSKQPDYRSGRSHKDFLTNAGVAADAIKSALIRAWTAKQARVALPSDRVEGLVRERYCKPEWNFKS